MICKLSCVVTVPVTISRLFMLLFLKTFFWLICFDHTPAYVTIYIFLHLGHVFVLLKLF